MSSVSPFRIVIVGGGIAGMTAAIALRGPNRHITVLEQSRLNKEIGALISLQPNASKIVSSTWGLHHELKEARAMVDEGFRIYNTDGQLVNTVPLLTKTQYGADRLCFHRRDLHDQLKSAAISPDRAGEPVIIRVATRVVDCDPLEGTVTLDGGEIVAGDLIVGADGIMLRKHVLQEEPSPTLTGHSVPAYRLMIPTEVLEKEVPEFCAKINPRDPFTSMIVAQNCRLVMGPGRQGEVFGIVALVPDEQMNEDPASKQSWVSEGNLSQMLATFAEFPAWVTNIFKHSADLGLWQLRDLNPLETWHRGRVILIGDAAHAMLPTQGQGASQAIEDSEALGAFFDDMTQVPSLEALEKALEDIFQARYSRVSLIQTYSREAAKPAAVKKTVTLKVKARKRSSQFWALQWTGSSFMIAGGSQSPQSPQSPQLLQVLQSCRPRDWRWPAKQTPPEVNRPSQGALKPARPPPASPAPEIAMSGSPETPRRSPRKTANHHCPHCDKTYERPDHLARHLDSRALDSNPLQLGWADQGPDRNERVYQCPTCQRGFNRRDVLQRHQAVHERDITEGKSSARRTRERAIEACEACAAAKLSCDNERPCKRCHTKQMECVPKPSRDPRRLNDRVSYPISLPAYSPQINGQVTGQSSDLPVLTDTPGSGPSEFSGPPAPTSYSGSTQGIYEPNLAPADEMALSPFISQRNLQTYSALSGFPAFFEQVMLPGLDTEEATQGTQQPRAFDFMQDTDFTLSENDIFGTDFIPDLDKILDTVGPFTGFEDHQHPSPDDQESVSRRAAAFKRSLWLWVPEKNQHAFSEEGRIPMRDSDSIPSTHQLRLDALQIPGNLSAQARDDIFKLVIRTAGSRLSISAFPSADYLDTLIKIGIGKRVETDAWIHLYTFYDLQYQQLRPELLTALVAAGCVCCGMPSINKTGIILQEITRVGLAQLVEDDNSVLRDLQYLQASMLWLDIGIFCGFTRKMQIAESYLQPLCTAVRRAAAFDRSTYTITTPHSFSDDDESLNKAWHVWVKQESLKRLVYHLFGHDVEVAAAMNRPAIISYTELTLPFPAARDLWLAPTARAWKDIWTRRYRTIGLSELNLRDLLSDPSLIGNFPPELDLEIARSALLQGLALQVWEFRQQMLLSQGSSRATTRLWLQSRQEDLYTILRAVQNDSPNPPPVTRLMNEFVMMYLHIDIDAIQRFVGKMGELDARRAYPGLRDWSRTKEARTAIWHAGQVFRAARDVSAHQFRGFDSLSIYHAALVLWVYGLLQCGESRHLEVTTPMSEADKTPPVPLDGPEDQGTRAFLGHGIGHPGLTMLQLRGGHSGDVKVFCELIKPRSVMAVARQVFEGNCPLPLPDDVLPPMIQNLCALIQDLGSLP
ncbi:hypothetical protein N7462_000066 [Penicillium macrosclerotiorum]|uniref:uncharacterized protein n=1 Tax=Penicillium macrosclerotiorum TaxID=303699 RepID=UPI0025479F48|nr:uncharacterized protein N7462_000066 [Penicillium macrosclerotiorum]KAJ5698061.1 hypothetical protein N7462_000066 [Penicillium macrosclerotiorum]